MSSKVCLIALVVLAAGGLCAAAMASDDAGLWYLDAAGAPSGISAAEGERPVVVAVVDDGVRITHRDLRDLMWVNAREVAGNGVDDDGNGYVDDVYGWDAADADGSVTPPADRAAEFYHGTHLAGIVARIARRAYGEKAGDYVRIMAVKCMADRAQKTYLESGYKGIEYAVKAGADVILCAWGVSTLAANEKAILDEAATKGVMVVGSAGTFADDKPQYPAAHEAVLAVAGVDRSAVKIERSNYGAFVDISAPGSGISAAGVMSDEDYSKRDGSSQAAAIVAAAAALVKAQKPGYTARMVEACLKNSATTMEVADQLHCAKMGAGLVNIDGAISCGLFEGKTQPENEMENPQGYLRFAGGEAATWRIEPAGTFKGIRFGQVTFKGDPGTSTVSFYGRRGGKVELLDSYPVAMLEQGAYVAGTVAYVTLEPKDVGERFEWLCGYRAEPIDFTRLYCRGTVRLDVEGAFDDGSGDEEYSPLSDCKWLITAPQGKVVDIRFSEFDTEAKVDLVYFFDGAGTHEKIMAIFSGPRIPPELTTWSNQVLVWFVTDGRNQGKGFRAEYRFVDRK